MRDLRRIFTLLLAVILVGCGTILAEAKGYETKMGTDDMGDGAEYDDTEDRATRIDEAGDGDYNVGDGSVVDEASYDDPEQDSYGSDSDNGGF